MSVNLNERNNKPSAEKVLLVGVDFGRSDDFANAVEECAQLVRAVDGEVSVTLCCKRARADAAFFIGKGKTEEIAQAVEQNEITLVVFNHNLSPSQERNLERVVQCRVLDRIGLILAIFARRARSQEGQLQVELAQLTHLSSRLVRGYKHLQSQKGGIGLKGPGETQLETDRRLIDVRIHSLKTRLSKVQKQRQTQRQKRQKNDVKTVALVGYTNAGKSSLFNRLTKADVFAEDLLFATLDATSRKLFLNDRLQIILVDTVGFIQDLPHALIKAFAATLEEAALADLLLHVVDYSNPFYEHQIEQVNRVLTDIGASEVPALLVYNKTDLLPEPPAATIAYNLNEDAVTALYVSSKTGAGMEDLRASLIRHFSANPQTSPPLLDSVG